MFIFLRAAVNTLTRLSNPRVAGTGHRNLGVVLQAAHRLSARAIAMVWNRHVLRLPAVPATVQTLAPQAPNPTVTPPAEGERDLLGYDEPGAQSAGPPPAEREIPPTPSPLHSSSALHPFTQGPYAEPLELVATDAGNNMACGAAFRQLHGSTPRAIHLMGEMLPAVIALVIVWIGLRQRLRAGRDAPIPRFLLLPFPDEVEAPDIALGPPPRQQRVRRNVPLRVDLDRNGSGDADRTPHLAGIPSASPQEPHEQLGLSDGHWVTPHAELGSFDVRVEPFPRVADTSNPSPTQVGSTHAGDAIAPQPSGDATQTTPDAPRRDVSPGLAPVPQVAPAASVATANSSAVTTDGVPRLLLPDVRVTVGPPLVAPHELVDAIFRLAKSDPLAYETIAGITQSFTAMAPVTPGTSNLLSIPSSTQSVMNQPHVGTTIPNHSTVSSPTAPESASRSDVVQADAPAADATAPGPVPLNGVASKAKRAAQYNRWADSEGRPIAGPSRLG